MRLERMHLPDRAARPGSPGRGEGLRIARRIMRGEEIAVAGDRSLDEVARRRGEDRAPFGPVAREQTRAGPAPERGIELPGAVHGILEARVDAVAAIGWVAVRGVPGDEDAPGMVGVRHRDPEVPEADMLHFEGDIGANRRPQQPAASSVSRVVPRGMGAWKKKVDPRSTRPRKRQ